jgi:hypothetical protein
MSFLPGPTRQELLGQRLDLLHREAEHAERARELMREAERSARAGDGALLEEARRAVRLADETLALGLRDTHRVGASLELLAQTSGLDVGRVRRSLLEGGVAPEDLDR